MDKDVSGALREEARNWTCHNLAVTEHGGDAAALLRKAADAVEQLGDIEIPDVTYRRPTDLAKIRTRRLKRAAEPRLGKRFIPERLSVIPQLEVRGHGVGLE